MDPTLLALLASARDRNKNVSGVLGNLDNPLFAYLAGVYDPNTEFSSGASDMPMYSRYSSDPNTPELIRNILSSVEAGYTKYDIEGQIDQLAAANPELLAQTGMQVDTLKSLAGEISKEYSEGAGGGTSSKTWWKKAGLPNPLELYTTETVPLGETSRQQVAALREPLEMLASKKAARGASVRETLDKARGVKAAVMKPDDNFGKSVLGFGAKQLMNILQMPNMPLPTSLAVQSVKGKTKTKKASKDYVDVTSPEYKAYEKAALERANVETEISNRKRQEEAIRRGRLRAYEESGKTPTGDAMAAMLKLITKSA